MVKTYKLFSTGSTSLFQEASILFQHIIPEVIVLFVELRPFPPSHLRTFLLNFVATCVYALSLKSLSAVFFSFPCLSFFLTLFEPNSEFHLWGWHCHLFLPFFLYQGYPYDNFWLLKHRPSSSSVFQIYIRCALIDLGKLRIFKNHQLIDP